MKSSCLNMKFNYFVFITIFLLSKYVRGSDLLIKSSLTFVIDDTGSMTDDINAVKDGAIAIFDTVMKHNESQIDNFILVTFNDHDTITYPITIDKGVHVRANTNEVDVFKKAISDIYLIYNYDCPEYAMAGIKRGLEESLPRSDLYVFTDASAKDYKDFEEVKNLAQRKLCRIIFVLTGICSNTKADDYTVYHELATATDGEVFHLSKTEVGRILEYVQKTITGRRTTLATIKLQPGMHNITFTADMIIKEITLSLSSVESDNPTVTITAPDGSNVPLTLLVQTDKIKVYSIDIAIPGVYTAKVENKKETRAKVSAKSGIDFLLGFSKFKLPSIDGTGSRPLLGVKSHLLIKLTKGDIDLKSVRILVAGSVTSELPLEIVDKDMKFYTTEAFDPPNTTFKVMIIGYDPISKTNITREVPTPIEPQKMPKDAKIETKIPSVVIEGESTIIVKDEKPVQLLCKINAYPKPDVVWINKNTGEVYLGETSIMELPYDYLNVLDNLKLNKNTTYECNAINSLGSDSTEITIVVPVKFRIIKTPKHINIEYGKDGKVECLVDAYPPAEITWHKNGVLLKSDGRIQVSSNKSTLTIKDARPSDKGRYMCEVRNTHNRRLIHKRVFITGLEPPAIDKSTSRTVTVKEDDTVDLECRVVKGTPKATITWIYVFGISSEESVDKPEWDNQEIVTIKRANRYDSGKYTCVATNEISSDYKDIDVIVEYAPSIKVQEEPIVAQVGEKIHLFCEVDGTPKPSITWSKDGVNLTDDDDRITTFRDNSLEFIARTSDSGTYKCSATNKLGSVSEKVYVEINDPVYITPPKVSSVTAMKGDMFALPCQASGHPKPTIQWIYHSFNSSALATKTIEPEKHGELLVIDAQVNDEGYYTCVASNSNGITNITYQVFVYEAANIKNKHRNLYEAVEGDLALILTCEASGHPKPTITWSKNGLNLASGSEYYIANDVLVLRNVRKDTEGTYNCFAENVAGSDDARQSVRVHRYPSSIGLPTTPVLAEKGELVEIDCAIPHTLVDKLRWYKNDRLIHEGELIIGKASEHDAGLYTCRVSNNFKSESANVEVSVGKAPRFTTNEETDVEMMEGMSLQCENEGNPKPSVSWYQDNRPINWTESELYFGFSRTVPGQYRCEVQNSFGNISRTFNVTLRDCFIDVNKLTKLQPLMISGDANWPMFERLDNFLVFMKGQQFILFCPNKFKTFPQKHVYAFCEGGTNVQISGKIYDYSDIQCTEEVKHIVHKTGKECFGGNTEKIIITYKDLLMFEDRTVYEVCWDKRNNIPKYAMHIMQNNVANSDYEAQWSDGDKLPMNYTVAYDCNQQIHRISSLLGRWFHRYDRCCFSQRQLVNPRDVFPGIPQKATYSYFNVVPHWSTCNAKNWEDIEDKVRARNSYTDLLVWTGTAKEIILNTKLGNVSNFFSDRSGNRQPVPMYLWKVVQDPASRQSLAIIQVNVADLSPRDVYKYVLCKDVCNTIDWMTSPHWHDLKRGYTYCCQLNEFEEKFGLRGVFRSGMEPLLASDAFLLPETSLTV